MIALTGGHLTPALALIEILSRGPESLLFFGRRFAAEDHPVLAQEARLITGFKVKFIPVITGKIPRHLSWRQILAVAKIPLGFGQSLWYLWRYRPRLIICFGGYLAVPVALAGSLLQIPILMHEPSLIPGLANRLIAKLARRIALSWPGQPHPFPPHKTVLTGHPLRSAILHPPPDCPLPLKLQPRRPLIYVTGGNQGSRAINQALFPILPSLLHQADVIHQTGQIDAAQFHQFKTQLSPQLIDHYWPQPWFEAETASWCLHHANLVISRSGAATMAELAFTGTPALFIPLPHSSQNEQLRHAQLLQTAGTAKILLQSHLTPTKLLHEVRWLLRHQALLRSHQTATRHLIVPDAAARLAALVHEF